jgi:hypothetical protein
VRDAFAEIFAGRRELGGVCCAYHHGEKVVDLWGGVRNKLSGEPRKGGLCESAHIARALVRYCYSFFRQRCRIPFSTTRRYSRELV